MSCMSILFILARWMLRATDDRVVFTSHKYVTQQVVLVVEPTMIDNACGILNLVVRGMPYTLMTVLYYSVIRVRDFANVKILLYYTKLKFPIAWFKRCILSLNCMIKNLSSLSMSWFKIFNWKYLGNRHKVFYIKISRGRFKWNPILVEWHDLIFKYVWIHIMRYLD